MHKHLSITICTLALLFLVPVTISLAVSPGAEPGNRPLQAISYAGWSSINSAHNDFDCNDVTEIPLVECEALVDLYDATNGDQWTSNTSWLTTNEPCGWYGVSCSGGYVVGLYLTENNLQGALPASFSDLSALDWVSFNNNKLTGISDSIGILTSLKSLYLDRNLVTTLPDAIGNLTSLEALGLSSNQLSSLPDGLGNLTSLQTLLLDNNQLTSLPAWVGNLTNLTYLSASKNMLTSLPSVIGNLTALKYLYLDNNKLAALPQEFGSLINLEELYLHNNSLSGEMPAFLINLTKLGTGWYMTSPFTFYNTNWCVPQAGNIPTWLAGIDHEGTGLVCGLAPGGISGTVTLADATPLAGFQINIYRTFETLGHPGEGGQGLVVTHTLTGVDGSYLVGGLGEGIGYLVQFVDPTGQYGHQYYENVYIKEQATPVTVTAGTTIMGIDAVMGPPLPPIVTIDTDSGNVSYNPDGTANISMYRGNMTPITFTLPITCPGGITPTNVNLLLTPYYDEFPMTAVGGDLYEATIVANELGSGTVSTDYTCNGTPVATTVAYITLYDPSGIVSDAISGEPIVGALVRLYFVPGWIPRTGAADTRPDTCESNLSKAEGVPWSQPAPSDLGIVPNAEIQPFAPRLSYQLTDETGYYGWDVSEGCWYVKVEAGGYQPLTSPVVGVPPEVTDLDLKLMPNLYLPLLMR